MVYNYSSGIQCPCKDCEDRQLYCHSNCELYLEWKKDRDEKIETYNKESKAYNDVQAVKYEARKKGLRRLGRKI